MHTLSEHTVSTVRIGDFQIINFPGELDTIYQNDLTCDIVKPYQSRILKTIYVDLDHLLIRLLSLLHVSITSHCSNSSKASFSYHISQGMGYGRPIVIVSAPGQFLMNSAQRSF
jgi:hypothetical protein